MNGDGSDILLGTVVPLSWYRRCTSAAAAHFSEMARERCNAVRIDVTEEDLVFRMQEVAAVVQLGRVIAQRTLQRSNEKRGGAIPTVTWDDGVLHSASPC
jgi:hypothetical protein